MAWGKAGREWEEEWKDDRIGYSAWYKVGERWNICDEKGRMVNSKKRGKRRRDKMAWRDAKGLPLSRMKGRDPPPPQRGRERVKAWYIKKYGENYNEKGRRKKKLEKSLNEIEIEIEWSIACFSARRSKNFEPVNFMPLPPLFFRSIRRSTAIVHERVEWSGVEWKRKERAATWKMAVTANPIGFREN